MQSKKSTSAWARHQKRWFGKWHLYLGIIAGFIIAIVGVTGSILVFQDEIDRALNPELFTVLAKQKKIAIEDIVPIIKQKHPEINFTYIGTTDKTQTSTFRIYDGKLNKEIFINPYTAEICGKRPYGSSFISVTTEIHRTLLIPVAGRYIVGLSSLCLLILTISGLRLWIPKKWKQLKSVLTIDFRANFKRQNYDWHNVLGFYTSPVVCLLALTGFCITFSLIVVPFLFILNGKSPQGVAKLLGAKSAYHTGAAPLPLSEIARIGRKELPSSSLEFIVFPTDSLGAYRLDFVSPYVSKAGKREMLIVDQYNGKRLLNSNTDFPNVGNAYLSWLTPLHYGTFGGLSTQILALIGGLIPLVLFITGFIIWWPRYRKQKKKDRKKAAVLENGPTPITDHDHSIPDTAEKIPVTISLGQYFKMYLSKGFRYALWMLLLSLVMGIFYGLISGIVIQPAVFSLIFTGILIIINFMVALIVLLFNVIFLAPFKRSYRPIFKYFALSLSFIALFLPVLLLINLSGLKIF